jgi:ribonuclease HI
MREIILYTDGACRGNPGPGGYGCILQFTDAKGQTYSKELSAGYRETTNNRMELLAAIVGLETLRENCKVHLYSDSQYLVNAFQKGWLAKWKQNGWYKDAKKKEPVKNEDLWRRLDRVMAYHEVEFHWVKGHAENAYNNRCDEMAVAAALDTEHHQEDVRN